MPTDTAKSGQLAHWLLLVCVSVTAFPSSSHAAG